MKTKLKSWGFSVDRMFLIAGPCSAESEEQVVCTAKALAAQGGVSLLRAGIWKPRTRPGSFEGVGAPGLAWLVRAREETGLKICTEVADPKHVEHSLEHGLDAVWIGARTTTNPFSVQAVADALAGTDIPVFVKNPMSADIGLWIGAIERLSNAGITRIAAIHRGFSSRTASRYRNLPDWKTPIELMRTLPEMPIFCDPSHICGSRALIHSAAQEALDLLFDGLMIEVHPSPDKALSDAAQQLTPAAFWDLIEHLNLPSERSDNTAFFQRLKALRNEVDDLDDRLLDLLAMRMDVVRKMGVLKEGQNVSTFQPERWKAIVQDRVQKGVNLNLSEQVVMGIMQSIHEEAVRQQEIRRLNALK